MKIKNRKKEKDRITKIYLKGKEERKYERKTEREELH